MSALEPAKLVAALHDYASKAGLEERLEAAGRLQQLVLESSAAAVRAAITRCRGDPTVSLGAGRSPLLALLSKIRAQQQTPGCTQQRRCLRLPPPAAACRSSAPPHPPSSSPAPSLSP